MSDRFQSKEKQSCRSLEHLLAGWQMTGSSPGRNSSGNRFLVAAEYEAVQLYMQLAEWTDHELAIEVLKDIADEERVHAGEFLRLLKELAPDEERFYAEGSEEVEELIEKLKKS